MSEVPEGLVDYLADRDREHFEEIKDALADLTPREKRLIKEAAVMGYVRGALTFGGSRAQIPPDSVVLCDVVGACLTMPELYPTIARHEQGSSDG